MKTIRGLSVDRVECVDRTRNVFHGVDEDTGFIFTVKQPSRMDTREHKKAWNQLTENTVNHYKRLNLDDEYYDSKYRCSLPKFQPSQHGFLPLVMIIDGNIVGFADMLFYKGDEYMLHDIPLDDVGCSMNLCVLDSYQGLGIGYYYSVMSVKIAKHFKADWALGFTERDGAMWRLRKKQGWTLVGYYQGNYVVIKKQL